MVNKFRIRRRGLPSAIPPKCSCRVIDGQVWVTIAAHYSPGRPIPASAFNYKDLKPSAYSSDPTVDGYFRELEWGYQPDWYRRETHWRAWIPNIIPFEWWDMVSNPILNDSVCVESGNRYRIPSDFQKIIASDLTAVHFILTFLLKRVRDDVRKKCQIPLPSRIFMEDITFDERLDLLQYFCGIQRSFLEHLGVLRWIMAWDDDIDNNLGYAHQDCVAQNVNLNEKIDGWDLRRPGGRGVLIDLGRDWREVNISLYVDHEVPVHYLWTQQLQLDPRFRSLSPVLLEAVDDSQLLPDWVERPGTGNPLVTTHRSDQFLQLYYPPCDVVKLRSGPKGVKIEDYVVDFEGWRARSIFKTDKSLYMGEFWYEEVSGVVNSARWFQRTFHRYRPVANLYDEEFCLILDDIHLIREIHKFACCPPPFQQYTPPRYLKTLEPVSGLSIPSTGSHSLVLPPPKPIPSNPYDHLDDDVAALGFRVGTVALDTATPSTSVLSGSVPLGNPPLPSQNSTFSRRDAHPAPHSTSASSLNVRRDKKLRSPSRGARIPRAHRWGQSDNRSNSGWSSWSRNDSSFDGRKRPSNFTSEGDARDMDRGEFMQVDNHRMDSGTPSGSESRPATGSGHQSSGVRAVEDSWVSSGWGDLPPDPVWMESNHLAKPVKWGFWENKSTGRGWDDPSPSSHFSPMTTTAGQAHSEKSGASNSSLVNQPRLSTSGSSAAPPDNSDLPPSIVLVTSLAHEKITTIMQTSGSSNSSLVSQPLSSTSGPSAEPERPPNNSNLLPSTVLVTPLVRDKITAIMQTWVSSAPTIGILHVTWSPSLLAHAIFVIDPASECRIRYQSLVHVQWTLQDILDDALQRGIPFELGLPLNALSSFAPDSLQVREAFYTAGFQDQGLQWSGEPLSFFMTWREAASRILSRPHARAFLFKGGLLWRLARWLGPPTIMQSAAQGFSVGATCYGYHRSARPDSPVFIEHPSPQEMSIVLGTTTNNSRVKYLWPPDDVFKQLICWTGEWNEACELWFKAKLNAMESGAAPRTRPDWQRDTRYGRRDRVDHGAVISSALSLFPGRPWDGSAAKDIILP